MTADVWDVTPCSLVKAPKFQWKFTYYDEGRRDISVTLYDVAAHRH